MCQFYQLNNKMLFYKQIIKPVWTYGIKLWLYIADGAKDVRSN